MLRKLQTGDKVFVKDPNSTYRGVVSDTSNTPRSYVIQTPSGLFRRNRRMLTKIPKKPDEDGKSEKETEHGNEQLMSYENVPQTEHRDQIVKSQVFTRSGRQSKPVQRLDL